MKWAPLTEDSLYKTPLLATIPTSYPYNLAKPVTNVVPYSFLNSLNLEPSTILEIKYLLSTVFLKSGFKTALISSESYKGSSILLKSKFTSGVLRLATIDLVIYKASNSS